MFYIHQSTCISPQQTFSDVDLENINPPVNNKVYAIEPAYKGIPAGVIRRMGKAVRMGVGSALPLLMENKIDGIVISTANGGIQDSLTFLNQIVDYQEGRLTPTHFVQSTYNAIAGQLGMITKNKGYNATHVHHGLAFENAVLDVTMLLFEYPDNAYILGGVDELSERNSRLEALDGWYKDEPVAGLYDGDSKGTLAGEGAAMYVVSNNREGATAKFIAVKMLNTYKEELVPQQLQEFIKANLPEGTQIDLLITGENGDNRIMKYYTAVESLFGPETTVARFKHLTGEFQTASALATWFACYMLQTQNVPGHFIKRGDIPKAINTILLYNTYKGGQHSFMLLQKA